MRINPTPTRNVGRPRVGECKARPKPSAPALLVGRLHKGGRAEQVMTLVNHGSRLPMDCGCCYVTTNQEDCCHAQIDGAVVLTGYLPARGGKTNTRSACTDWIEDGLE